MKQKQPNTGLQWTYQQEADITIGEQKMSPLAKIVAISLAILIVVAIAAGIIFRNQIYDYVVNPGLVIPNETVEVELGSKIKLEDYYIKSDDGVDVYDIEQSVDTSKLGSYDVIYHTKNDAKENDYKVTIKVVDKTAPTIELTATTIILTRGTDEVTNFDASKYIKDYKDNYDKKKDLTVTYTKTINTEKESQDVTYTVSDKSNNTTVAKLTLVIKDAPATETASAQPAASSSGGSSNNSSNNSSSSSSSDNSSSYSAPAATSAPSTPYINGVHDVTVAKGTSMKSLTDQLIAGVGGSGSVTVDYSSVNMTRAGSYTVTFSSSDGVTKTATVTVTE